MAAETRRSAAGDDTREPRVGDARRAEEADPGEDPKDLAGIENRLKRTKSVPEGVRVLVKGLAAQIRDAAPEGDDPAVHAQSLNNLANQISGRARPLAEALTTNTDSQQGRGDGEVAGRPLNA